MDRRLLAAALLVVLLTGCQGLDRTPAPTAEDSTPTTERTVTPDPAPQGPPDSETGLNWRVGQAVGVSITNDTIGELVVLVAHPGQNASFDVEDATILLQHDGRTARIVSESAGGEDADATFSLGTEAFDAPRQERRFGTSHELAVSLSGENGPDMDLTAGDTVTMLVRTPNVTTTAVTAVVPGSLAGERAAILYGEFAGEDRRGESGVVGKPQVVDLRASALTDAGAGVVTVTVTKLPGSAPVDYREARLRVTGPNGTALVTHPSVNRRIADGHFGLTVVRDTDGSAPVLTDGDRFALTLDLGTNDTAVDDGPAGTSVGGALGDSFRTSLVLETAGRQRYLRVALPSEVTNDTVQLRGVVGRDETFPRTNQRPVLTPLGSDSQRLSNGTAIGGLSVNLRKPPTADPIDPRTLTVDLSTPGETYTLVHRSQDSADADGHFGLEHRFNPDGSTPILDDYMDFARLTIDVGPNSRPGDDGPLGTSVGEPIPAETLLTVTVRTESGVAVPTQFYVTPRERGRDSEGG